jgi:hypothetical protein
VVGVVGDGDDFELSVALIIRRILLVVIYSLRFERYLHVFRIEILVKFRLMAFLIFDVDVLCEVKATYFSHVISFPASIFFKLHHCLLPSSLHFLF